MHCIVLTFIFIHKCAGNFAIKRCLSPYIDIFFTVD